ncbi:MAG: coenzyme-B sulfoethylthiotransferase subunit gamma [Methanosarcinales archaeon]|jgi:methyl-coenzyme M reductase gamma subunit|nr:coenzyme-B sulfoethylthiotransferase subunit gamma [Methanosarcinales archaeon]
MTYTPQYYPGATTIAQNRRKQMAKKSEKIREISDEDLTLILGHRAPGSDYKSTHPPLSEMTEPECSIREIVEPTPGAKAGDGMRYIQFVDSMYNSPSVPYFRTYMAAINFRGVDPGTLSGRQIVEARERDMEVVAKHQLETDMSCPALSSLRGAAVHGHSLRLPENGLMFDMLERSVMKDGEVMVVKDQVGRLLDREVNMGKPMSEDEAAKRTTIYRADNVPFREDKEVIELVHRIWQQRTEYGFQPK